MQDADGWQQLHARYLALRSACAVALRTWGRDSEDFPRLPEPGGEGAALVPAPPEPQRVGVEHGLYLMVQADQHAGRSEEVNRSDGQRPNGAGPAVESGLGAADGQRLGAIRS